MEEKKLFLKYNMVYTHGSCKDAELTRKIRQGKIEYTRRDPRTKILLLLHGSYKCNLHCIYCENQHLRSEYRGVTISEDMVREVVEKLGDHLNEVTWHGGEPLVLPRNLLVALEEEKLKQGFDFTTSLQTNSVLLDSEMLDFLDKYDIQVGTSFDGLTNSDSRGVKSTEAILRCLKEFPHRVGFICVTHKGTIDSLIKNYEYFKTIGVQRMQSCIVRENVIEEDNPYLVNNDIAVPKMLEYIDYWIHDTKSPIHDSYVVRHIQRLLGFTHLCEDINCIGGWLIMDPLGNIGFCGHSQVDDGIVNIKDISSYEDIITHPKYLKGVSSQHRLLKSCETCNWYSVCYGACMGLNYEYSHDYSKISPRNCEYNNRLLEGIYELIKDIDVSRKDIYNPIFLEILQENTYYSLSEIRRIEEENLHG